MKKYKICVYAICKNEEKFVERWMESMSEADMVVVTDTGSCDNTVGRLRSRGAIVHDLKLNPWRFDTARNISLEHVPLDVDICVCTDLDELFEPGWRVNLEKAWEDNEELKGTEVSRTGRYLYNWSFKNDNTPDVQFYYFKVHDRNGFKWNYPVHECIKYIGDKPLETIFINGMVLNHYPDHKKSRDSYLELLEMGVMEDNEDDRLNYYLGREYMYRGEYDKCIKILKNYLLLDKAIWKEERGAAMRCIAKSYFELKDVNNGYAWYYRAIAEVLHMRDAYVEFARYCYVYKDYVTIYFLTREAFKIK